MGVTRVVLAGAWVGLACGGSVVQKQTKSFSPEYCKGHKAPHISVVSGQPLTYTHVFLHAFKMCQKVFLNIKCAIVMALDKLYTVNCNAK